MWQSRNVCVYWFIYQIGITSLNSLWGQYLCLTYGRGLRESFLVIHFYAYEVPIGDGLKSMTNGNMRLPNSVWVKQDRLLEKHSNCSSVFMQQCWLTWIQVVKCCSIATFHNDWTIDFVLWEGCLSDYFLHLSLNLLSLTSQWVPDTDVLPRHILIQKQDLRDLCSGNKKKEKMFRVQRCDLAPASLVKLFQCGSARGKCEGKTPWRCQSFH